MQLRGVSDTKINRRDPASDIFLRSVCGGLVFFQEKLVVLERKQ